MQLQQEIWAIKENTDCIAQKLKAVLQMNDKFKGKNMKKKSIYLITMCIILTFLLSGCDGSAGSATEYHIGDSIDVSTDDEHRITLTVEGVKTLDEKQRIIAGVANAEGKAIAIDFSLMALGKEDIFTYSFKFRVKNQAGKWIEPNGYLEEGKDFSLIQKYSAVYLIGDEDQEVTFFAYNNKKAVGKVPLWIPPLTDEEGLEGYDVQAQFDNLSFRLPDGYRVDDTAEPFTAASPQDELIIEAWHYTGAKGKNEKELAEETFSEMAKELEGVNESTGVFSEKWNGRDWYDQYDYSDEPYMKYQYMLAVEGDDYYVVRFNISLSEYSGEIMDQIDTISNLMLLTP